MIKKLMLLALLAFSSVAGAQEYGNPVAYARNDKGGLLVLTDKENKKLCPPKMALVVAKNSKTADSPVMLGCWVAMRNEQSMKIEVLISWLPNYDVQWIRLEELSSMSGAAGPCTPVLSL